MAYTTFQNLLFFAKTNCPVFNKYFYRCLTIIKLESLIF